MDNLTLEAPDTSAAADGPQLKYVDANGVRFAYLEQGRGPLAMFLQELPVQGRAGGRGRTEG